MFTGLIEEVGKIISSKPFSGGLSLEVKTESLAIHSKIGDSIALNGVCLTVTKLNKNNFSFDAVHETIRKTTLAQIKVGTKVNLEPALAFGNKLGGHLVQGHVNQTGKITSIKNNGGNYIVSISIEDKILKYIVKEGSIAIDGISLTVAKLSPNVIVCSIIPLTWYKTNLCYKKVGDKVNIEVDVMAKYAENFKDNSTQIINNITEDWLTKIGY